MKIKYCLFMKVKKNMKRLNFKIVMLIMCSFMAFQVEAKEVPKPIDTIPLKYGAHRTGNRTDAAMERWRSYGLGQFIHWGVYAIPGGQWEGKTYGGAAEWIRSWSKNSAPQNWTNTYDNFYKQFNPTAFDAKAWAKQAKYMGAKYVIFTTKHHDGFSLWPSKYTNYTIKNTPYKKDIVKQVVDAYDAEGIDVYLYFSIIDWNHPGYRSAEPKTPAEISAYEDFKKFTRNQLLELLKNYPSIKGFWFDGTWDQAWIKQAQFTDELERELRKLHPGLIIGSRFRADEYGKRHFDSNGEMMGDYEQGWERKLPATIEVTKGRDWDCVMTIPPNQWGYNKDWKSSYIKTDIDLLAMLMQSVSLNGNLVINFGPDGLGAIRPEETEVAKEIGDWMQLNSEAVYGVKYAGLTKPDYGYYTLKGNKLYLTVFNRPVNNLLRIALPANYKKTIQKASLLQNKQDLSLKRIHIGLSADNNQYYEVQVPETFQSTKPFVVVLEMNDNNQGAKTYGDAKT